MQPESPNKWTHEFIGFLGKIFTGNPRVFTMKSEGFLPSYKIPWLSSDESHNDYGFSSGL
jgi:hypothetical protein